MQKSLSLLWDVEKRAFALIGDHGEAAGSDWREKEKRVWNLIAFEMHGKRQGLAQVCWWRDMPEDHVVEKLP